MWEWWVFFGALFLFLVAVVLYVVFLRGPATYKLDIHNDTGTGMTVQIGMITGTTTTNALFDFLAPGTSLTVQVTPGVSLAVGGFRGSISTPSLLGTGAIFNFPNDGYFGPYYIIHNGVKVPVVTNTFAKSQQFGVSLTTGANMRLSVESSNSDCAKVEFVKGIKEEDCPLDLRYGSPYQGCMNPCWATGTGQYCCFDGCGTLCQDTWQPGVYDVFHSSCPNCAITNCDLGHLIPCSNKGSLNSYKLVFQSITS